MKRNLINFLFIQVFIITGLFTTTTISNGTNIVGGVSDSSIQECNAPFQASEMLLKSNGHNLSSLKIVSCQKQIVAGTNYNFQLKLSDGRICHMKVWQKLPNQGRVDYEINQEESTCLHSEFNGKEIKGNKTDGTPVFKTIWMFLSVLVFCVSLI